MHKCRDDGLGIPLAYQAHEKRCQQESESEDAGGVRRKEDGWVHRWHTQTQRECSVSLLYCPELHDVVVYCGGVLYCIGLDLSLSCCSVMGSTSASLPFPLLLWAGPRPPGSPYPLLPFKRALKVLSQEDAASALADCPETGAASSAAAGVATARAGGAMSAGQGARHPQPHGTGWRPWRALAHPLLTVRQLMRLGLEPR